MNFTAFYCDSISIHALRGEGDHKRNKLLDELKNFNPRPPWGGRRKAAQADRLLRHISIHALRGEGDPK